MGRFDSLVSALKGAWKWIQRIFKKIGESVVHVKAIKERAEWFYDQYEELSPEARVKIDEIMYHLEQLELILGFE